MSATRKIAALMVADMVGYSRLAGADEERTLARLRAVRSDLIDPSIAVHHGRLVNRTGEGVVVEFRSVVDAVRCALEVQDGKVERNAGVPAERRIELRMGIHLGDVVEESDGSNAALQRLAMKMPRQALLRQRRLTRNSAQRTFQQAIALALAGRLEEARPLLRRGYELEPGFRVRLFFEYGLAPILADELIKGARMLGIAE